MTEVPWHIVEGHSECPSSESFAVVKDDGGEVVGCHGTRGGANDQLAALYANEPVATRANLSTAAINDLPDSAFAYIEPGGEKDSEGRTAPRSLRHFPIHDAAHVRNALARASQSPFGDKAMPRIRAAAKKFGIEISDDDGDRSASAVEVIERSDSVVLDDVRFKERIIDVIAVPWEQEAEVMWRGQAWREVFERGAFNGIEGHAGRYPVNREHVQGDTVGKVVSFDPYSERGLIASAHISRTPRGDDTLELAADGILGASVGYFVKQPSDYVATRRNMLRRIKRAFVHHLAMTASPAFDSAMPVAVREGPPARGVAGEPLPPTPGLEAVMFDDVFRWANERVNRST